VNLHDRARRIRWTGLLLAAILIPTAVVIFLGFRVVRQERELGERRASDAHRDALEQLHRELTARLQALRLEEVNRLIGESGTRLPPESPIVFVAPMAHDRLVLPWERRGADASHSSAAFLQQQDEGERLEFQRRDAAHAIASFRAALSLARTPFERCTARVTLARAYLKAGMPTEAKPIDDATLVECSDVFDQDGVPLAVYAAEHLLDAGRAPPQVADYVVHAVNQRRWPAPSETFALRSLLQRMPAAVAAEPLQKLTLAIRDIEQVNALASDLQAHPDKLQRMSRRAPGDLPWMGYGDEPWLVTLVSPTSFAAPVVMAVSSRHSVPSGVTLRTSPAPAAEPLGDGFVDLYVQWAPGRFVAPPPRPAALYGTALAVVFAAVLVAGYSLLRDVQRESDTALMRSSFVASVSHELKTPLTSIRAHAETLILGRAPDAETADDYLKTIVSESERLGRLVESVLEFSRIEQGRKVYHMGPTRLGDVVCAAARTLKYPLEQLGFTLTITSDGTDPALLGDSEALTEAFLNLLNNAMKYSGSARNVEMRVGTRDGDAYVDVVDHGIGIAREDQSRIFDRFYRVQSAETAGIAGAGLGLALALHAVEAHHGRIDVVSDVGRGSTFSVRIPLEAAEV
jgi:signal transduction histidine kinase